LARKSKTPRLGLLRASLSGAARNRVHFRRAGVKRSQTRNGLRVLFIGLLVVFNQRLTNMCKTETMQKRRLLNLEIDNLDSMESQLREQIKTLALRGCKIQCERMAKIEQLAKLNMTVTYDA
jgi:hypothetical protein